MKKEVETIIKVCRYNQGLAKAKFKGRRFRLYCLSSGSTLHGLRMFAEKNCVYISVPKGHTLAFGLPEADFFGHEVLVLTFAPQVNPVYFGRE